jgi:hypothetical protein
MSSALGKDYDNIILEINEPRRKHGDRRSMDPDFMSEQAHEIMKKMKPLIVYQFEEGSFHKITLRRVRKLTLCVVIEDKVEELHFYRSEDEDAYTMQMNSKYIIIKDDAMQIYSEYIIKHSS